MSVKIEILEYELDGSNIDWEKSILGELDITDNSDFPFALTFQISDIQEITTTSGDYSKTFKVPATKNNNSLLKNLYVPNIQNDKSPTKNMKCRVTFNGLDSLFGLLKVTGVGGYGETPSYYNCIFYGNNLSWANLLEGQYMDTVDWKTYGDNLVYKKPQIMATWADEHCDSSTSPLVYPITSYGVFNYSVANSQIQLLDTHYDWYTSIGGTTSASTVGYSGYNNGGNSYGTPEPSPDWRPAIFVKTTLENIFRKVGYSISSTFMNTDMFKKLVWLLPNFKYNNPDARVNTYSVGASFLNDAPLTVAADSPLPAITESGVQKHYVPDIAENDIDSQGNALYYTGSSRHLFNIATIGTNKNLQVDLDTNFRLNANTDEITVGEYGYYDLELSGLQVKCARLYTPGSSQQRYVESIDTVINLEVQTVGQTSWNIISNSERNIIPRNSLTTPSQWTFQTQPLFSDYVDVDAINISGRYLNAGDKIRITTGMRINASSNNAEFDVNIFWQKTDFSALKLSIAPDIVEYGQTYNLSDVMNKDYKQIDFIKGVAHAFNLNITTDEAKKEINLEPFDTFYYPYGNAIDWTYKLDRSKDTEDKFLKSDLKRKFIFKYKTDDEDSSVQYRGEQYFKDVMDEYPYQEELTSDFEKGLTTFENPFFAGTYNAKDQDTFSVTTLIDNLFSACLWKERENNEVTWAYQKSRPDKCYEFLPRLLYWNKYSPSTGGAGSLKYAQVQTWANTSNYIVGNADASVSNNLSIVYPQATSINRDDSTSPILSYGNVLVRDYNASANTYSSYVNGKGLYETYYKGMFEMFKRNPRIRTVSIDIKTSDVIDLDFRKLIYIDGFYWRLNRIIDYMPNKNESTKVELIEWFEIGTFAASAPPFGSAINNWGNSPISGGVLDDQNFGGNG